MAVYFEKIKKYFNKNNFEKPNQTQTTARKSALKLSLQTTDS